MLTLFIITTLVQGVQGYVNKQIKEPRRLTKAQSHKLECNFLEYDNAGCFINVCFDIYKCFLAGCYKCLWDHYHWFIFMLLPQHAVAPFLYLICCFSTPLWSWSWHIVVVLGVVCLDDLARYTGYNFHVPGRATYRL